MTADVSGPAVVADSLTKRFGSILAVDSLSFALAPGTITGYPGRVLFYVGVPDVGAALREAERLGGVPTMGPERVPGSSLVVGHFTDSEGHLIGVAGTA